MSHPDEGVLQELLDDELSGEDLRSAEAHVASCESCRVRLEAMRATMLEADGLVERLSVPEPGRRGAGRRVGEPVPQAPSRFRFSLGQMGIAAGLMVAVTAGLLLRDGGPALRQTSGQDALAAGRQALNAPTAAQETGTTERISGDTFRLRAGGAALETARTAERAEPKAVVTDRANDTPKEAERRQAAEPGAGLAKVAQPAAEAAVALEAPAAPAVRAPAAASNVMPAGAEHGAAHAAADDGRKQLGSLTPVRVDSMPGLVRRVYLIGTTEVVLEERGARAEQDEAAAKARRSDAQAPVAGQRVAEYRWTVDGVELVIRGALTRDSLMKLSTLLR